jgi:hypothetical protein
MVIKRDRSLINHRKTPMQLGSRDSVVGIVTGCGLDDRGFGVRVPVGSRIFSSSCRPNRLWGPNQPPIQWVPKALSPAVKRPGREADHSRPTRATDERGSVHCCV